MSPPRRSVDSSVGGSSDRVIDPGELLGSTQVLRAPGNTAHRDEIGKRQVADARFTDLRRHFTLEERSDIDPETQRRRAAIAGCRSGLEEKLRKS